MYQSPTVSYRSQKDASQTNLPPALVALDGDYMIQGQVPLWLLVLLLGLFLSAIVFCSTANDRPPKYQPVRTPPWSSKGWLDVPCVVSDMPTTVGKENVRSCDHLLWQQR